MNIHQRAERVMAERGLDTSDTTLRNFVVFKVVQALHHARRCKLLRIGALLQKYWQGIPCLNPIC